MSESASRRSRHMLWLLPLLVLEAVVWQRLQPPAQSSPKRGLPFDPDDPIVQRRFVYDPHRDPHPGQRGPVMILRDLDGVRSTQVPSRRHPTVVVFPSDCSSCGGGATIVQWDSLQRGHPEANVVVATPEDASAVRRVLTGRDLKLRVLLDTEGKTAKRYNARWHPRAYLLDRQGRIVYVQPDTQTEVDAIQEVSRRLKAITAPRVKAGV